jgi:hypothetical protein
MVELVVAPTHDGDASRLSVIETYASTSSMTTAAATNALAGWNLRLMSLAHCIDALALARR